METFKIPRPKCQINLEHANSHPGFRDLMLLIIAAILITISIILIRHSYENLFREPANMGKMDPGCSIACLRDLYNDPVHECQAQSKREPFPL